VKPTSTLDAQPWDEIFRRDGRVFDSPAPVVHHVAERFHEHGFRRVVDLGCGSGRHAVFLARQGFEVLGIDNSPTALRMSRQWLVEDGLDAALLLADMRLPLPLRSGACEAVLSTQVIHHALLETVRATARELCRILRPGGLLFVSVPLNPDPEDTFEAVEAGTLVPTSGPEKGLPHHFFEPDELCSLFPDLTILELDQIGGRILTLLGVRHQPAPEPGRDPRRTAGPPRA
jgi:SAM-dependent methyltransferase